LKIQRLNSHLKSLSLLLVVGLIKCGGHKGNKTPTADSPLPIKENFETQTEPLTPKNNPKKILNNKPLWVGDLRSLRLLKIDGQLNADKNYDLSSHYPQGGAGITAMSFLDPSHLAILIDPQMGLNGPTAIPVDRMVNGNSWPKAIPPSAGGLNQLQKGDFR